MSVRIGAEVQELLRQGEVARNLLSGRAEGLERRDDEFLADS